jgi:hypothetical protein
MITISELVVKEKEDGHSNSSNNTINHNKVWFRWLIIMQ